MAKGVGMQQYGTSNVCPTIEGLFGWLGKSDRVWEASAVGYGG